MLKYFVSHYGFEPKMPSLSKAERDFIEGKLKPDPNYKRVLLHRIKKKREEMFKELKLIDSFLEKLEK
ncbi:MAG: hypothetical protein QMD43_09945 [Thermodesulfovibrio sp.]|nr:hypothetical protein [Thermodesulfovibrio sp.]